MKVGFSCRSCNVDGHDNDRRIVLEVGKLITHNALSFDVATGVDDEAKQWEPDLLEPGFGPAAAARLFFWWVPAP